jgi:sortase A
MAPTYTPTKEQAGFAMHNQIFLRWASRVLFIGGVLAVSYVGFALLHAKCYQAMAERSFEKQTQVDAKSGVSPHNTSPKEGDILGRIEIPRLGMKVVILEGTTSQTLRLGVGHIEGTALPGEAGNVALAGHRDTFFRGLKDIRASDEIQVQSATGIARYEVDTVRVVAPDDIEVLAPSAGAAITLVTCYPFHFIGPAPERFVVHAHKQ